MQIALHLDPNSKMTLQMQIYEQLVAHIRGGRLKPGGALPSSRDLSKQLGVSRNTVSEAYEKLISRRNIRRRITIPLTLSNLKLLRRITRTENILHRNFTRRQVAIQNRVASNIGISQSTFSVKVLNLFSPCRRKTNKRKSK